MCSKVLRIPITHIKDTTSTNTNERRISCASTLEHNKVSESVILPDINEQREVMDMEKIYELLCKKCDKKISKRDHVEKFNEKIRKNLSSYIKHYDSVMKELLKERAIIKNKKVNTCLMKNKSMIYDNDYSFCDETERVSVNNSFYVVKNALTKNVSKEKKYRTVEDKSLTDRLPNKKSVKSLNTSRSCVSIATFRENKNKKNMISIKMLKKENQKGVTMIKRRGYKKFINEVIDAKSQIKYLKNQMIKIIDLGKVSFEK